MHILQSLGDLDGPVVDVTLIILVLMVGIVEDFGQGVVGVLQNDVAIVILQTEVVYTHISYKESYFKRGTNSQRLLQSTQNMYVGSTKRETPS